MPKKDSSKSKQGAFIIVYVRFSKHCMANFVHAAYN